MLRYLIALLILSACSKPTDFSSPAQSQIDAYRLQAKQCRVSQSQQANTNISYNASNKPEANTLFAINDNDIVIGDPNSSVIMIEYASPTCVHCSYFNKSVLPQLKKNYIDTGKIAFVTRLFVSNKQDLDAGILSLCASKTTYYKLIDVFFEKQDSWAFNSNYRDILTNIGDLSGVTPEQYLTCLNNKDLSDILINQSRNIGNVPGFVGTPTFVINGTLFDKPFTYENLAEALDKALK